MRPPSFAGTRCALLLLILALRSGEKQRAVRLGFALCTLTFTLSACVAVVGFSVSQSFQSPVVVLATDFAFFAAVGFLVDFLESISPWVYRYEPFWPI